MKSAHLNEKLNMVALLIATTFACVLSCIADDADAQKGFVEKADADFQRMIRSCQPERRVYWEGRDRDISMQYIEKDAELSRTKKLLSQQPNGKELTATFGFQYVNEMSELQLSGKTKLVRDLGHEVLEDYVSRELTPLVSELEKDFGKLKQSSDVRLQQEYNSFLGLKEQASAIGNDPPVKYSYTFKPMANAYATSPEKIVNFQLYDWESVDAQAVELSRSLHMIRNDVKSRLFFTPRDPHPWFTVLAQIVFLAATIAGSIKSYHGNAYRTIGVIALVSLCLSLFLIFVSADTIWNIFRQAVVPAGFMLYWIVRARLAKQSSSSTIAKDDK